MGDSGLDRSLISVHHIGGRGGTGPFPNLSEFDRDLVKVFYDADSDCISHIQEKNRNTQAKLFVLPYCFAATCGGATLNINYDPVTTSLLDVNEDYASYYVAAYRFDGIVAENLKTMQKRDIETVTLDHVISEPDCQLPPPDFLSIDAQGAEYQILEGAKQTLEQSVVALVLEVEFHPLYKGQKLFGQIYDLLSAEGFHFVRFLEIGEMSPHRGPIGLRGYGFQVYADALFLKRTEFISGNPSLDRKIMLQKLAFFAILFNQTEYALQCLEQTGQFILESAAADSSLSPAYIRFLAQFQEAASRIPQVYPPSFASVFTFETSTAQYSGYDELPALLKIRRKLQGFRFARWAHRTLNWLIREVRFPTLKASPVEALLKKYGLKSQAELLKKVRVAHMKGQRY